MPPKSKSIFRQPGAQHFQVVHRSQRDPLIHDPDAPKHVLKPFVRENDRKGKSRADLEQILAPEETTLSRPNVGEAALYGIYYDDSDYDYMQHLKPVGVQEEGVESILLEAPSKKKKVKSTTGIQLTDLPSGVLASTSELPLDYGNQQAVPESIAGFRPDLDPHLRQVLEALDDDEFIDDDLDGNGEDLFAELVADGERGNEDDVDFEFYEYGPPQSEPSDIDGPSAEDTWEKRFAQFKKERKPASDDDLDDSEAEDTVGGLPTVSVIGGSKRRRQKRAASDASGYSMSSSSLFRNEHLQTLDEAFDQVMLKDYGNDDDDGFGTPIEDDTHSDSDESDSSAPDLITSREDFDNMVTTFLNEYEILGSKIKPKLEGETGTEKLDTLRRAMGVDTRVMNSLNDISDESDEALSEEEKDKWDCETILTTYSNLENHPRLIRAREGLQTRKIILDQKTGMPRAETLVSDVKRRAASHTAEPPSVVQERKETITRSRDETKEDKKARKAAAKSQRAARRAEKKQNKDMFGSEMRKVKENGGSMVPMRKL